MCERFTYKDNDMLRVFIGFDPVETVAYHVAAHSIMRRTSLPVSITGLVLNQLPMTRERDPKQSTEFAFSRFLVPYLCDYRGVAVFMDCDTLCRVDILGILDEAEPHHAVSVVKHDYAPKDAPKFLDQPQSSYQRKNWSSVMVFNNALCTALTPEYVNNASGLDLHQFRWLEDSQIGALHRDWNHLVGEYEPNPQANIVHFTRGTPCFMKYRFCEYAREWFDEHSAMLHYDRIGEYSRPEREAA